MRIFAEKELSAWLRDRHERLAQEVKAADRDYLLNVNETQFIEHLVGRWTVTPLELNFDGVSVSDYEKDIPAERHPENFCLALHRDDSFPRHVVCYHIPFSGDAQLLQCRPSTMRMWSEDVSIGAGCVNFEIIDWYNKPEDVKRTADQILTNIKVNAGHVRDDVNAFNSTMRATVQSLVANRKKQLLTQLNTLAALGVPVRQAGNVPVTFAVPIHPRTPIVRPSAPSQAFRPEPTLDVENYDSILGMIHDYGVEMERHPSIYTGKDEEALRDHFLMMLSPHFQSTTGETFNKSGKTDILIRHEGKNAFVAECKFWRGVKAFHGTIDQLLGYLTWRDSKAAVVCFVDNKELNPVLEQVAAETPRHPCFIKDFGKKADGWFQYEFHLKDDPSRGVKLAVLCFHFAK